MFRKNINGRQRHLVVVTTKADQTHLWLLVLLALLIGPVTLYYVLYTFINSKYMSSIAYTV